MRTTSIAAAAATVLMFAVTMLAGIAGGGVLSNPASAAQPVGGEEASALAQKEIPPLYLRLYHQAARRYGLDWAILA